MSSFLEYAPPMGIYQTLYAFQKVFGKYMGESNTHPWTQGCPLTTKLPGGPKPIDLVNINPNDLKYPKAWGQPELRDRIAAYYNHYHQSNISMENIMVFAGGRPGLFAVLMFLCRDITVRVASTEYTPYYDILKHLNVNYSLVESREENLFSPLNEDYINNNIDGRQLTLLSNPCNPTGITKKEDQLKALVELTGYGENGLLIDEAYELFHEPAVSALKFVNDIDKSNIFVCGAATKGLQAPGIRIGWIISSKDNIEILGNFSSFGMGGVSRPSQIYATDLLERSRTDLAHHAVSKFYSLQREKYARAFEELGLKLFSGEGGFYHWCKLTNGMSADTLNQHLFKQGAAILKGEDCDMARGDYKSPLDTFFRFSFGPLLPDSFETDIAILRKVLE